MKLLLSSRLGLSIFITKTLGRAQACRLHPPQFLCEGDTL
jgi:hypothetical protein